MTEKKRDRLTLDLHTGYAEVAVKEISKKEFNEYTKVGITEDDLSELQDDLMTNPTYGSPVRNDFFPPVLQVSVNGAGVQDIDISELCEEAMANCSDIEEPITKGKCYVVLYQYMKRGHMTLTKVGKKFDISKLIVDANQCNLKHTAVNGYSLTYGGKDFEIEDLGWTNYTDCYLVSASGKQQEFKIIEDDYDDSSDN